MKGRERWGIRERMSPFWMAKTERKEEGKEGNIGLFSFAAREFIRGRKPMKKFYFHK